MELPSFVRSRLVDRDPEALGLLFDTYFDKVWAFLSRSLRDRAVAEDLAQDVFLRVHRGLDRYDPERPIGPWVMAIAANRLRDHWRESQKRSAVSIEDSGAAEWTSGSEGVQSDEELQEVDKSLRDALQQLSEDGRAVVELRVFADMSFDQIAQALEIQPATARKRLSRALDSMRGHLAKAQEFQGGR